MQAVAGAAGAIPTVKTVSLERPWQWLAAGWRDLTRVPVLSLSYGLLFAVVSGLIALGSVTFSYTHLLLPLIAGFMLVGPLLAVGLYELSRRLEQGLPVGFSDLLLVPARSPTSLAFIGLGLALFLLAWVRIATLLFALFFGTLDFPPLPELTSLLFFTWEGLGLLVVGTLVGGVLAFVVFAISAVSIPLLVEHDIDVVTAMGLSVAAVRRNPWAMLLWAWLIVVVTVFGLATLFLGLIVTFPLVGHATWHAYRDLLAVPKV